MKLDHLEILAGFSELSEEEINDFVKRGWHYHPGLNTGGLYVMSIQYDRFLENQERLRYKEDE